MREAKSVSETRTFTVGQILTVMHGRMVCPVSEIYEILNWMTGESLMTHQLPRASRESEDWLCEQFPDLAEIDVYEPTITCQAEAEAWLASLASKYGTHREVRPLSEADHTQIDPIAEIKMMRPDLPIINVEL